MFMGTGSKEPKNLRFAKQSRDDKAIWASIIEKAWAKARGNYERANGDTVTNAISLLTGVPVYDYLTEYITTQERRDAAYTLMKAAEDAHYIMGA